MFARIRTRFTYTNVMVTLALVFAMTGGAYAAKKYVITSTKQIKPAVLKQLEGKAGAAGPAGQQGLLGPQGAAGAKGDAGTPGEKGADGVSVTSKEVPKSSTACNKEGGSEFVAVGNKQTFACNGSPWTAGGTLPKGKSVAGAWSVFFTASAADQGGSSAISFTLPLKAEPEAHYIGTKEELAGEKNEAEAIKEGQCKGTPSQPEAAEGNLCIFAELENHAKEYLFDGFIPTHTLATSVDGSVVAVGSSAAGEVAAGGKWIVTGN